VVQREVLSLQRSIQGSAFDTEYAIKYVELSVCTSVECLPDIQLHIMYNTLLSHMPIGMQGIYCLLFVCFLSVCRSVHSILVTDISGMGGHRAVKFCRVVDLGDDQVISPLVNFGPWVNPRPKKWKIDNALDGRSPGATNWPGSREARVTNCPPLAVTAIGMWGLTGVLVIPTYR